MPAALKVGVGSIAVKLIISIDVQFAWKRRDGRTTTTGLYTQKR
ncbi:hypothetical protein LINPERPRIM_LOCUS23729 [Linum perenne]